MRTKTNGPLSDEDTFLKKVQALQDKIWPKEISRDLYYPHGEIAITDYLRRWAQKVPDRSAFIFYGYHLSYQKLDEYSDRCAAMLQANGISKGDPVAVYMGSCPQFIIAFFGILKAGGIHVPVNPMFKEHELLHELKDSGATIVISEHGLVPLVRKVQADSCVRLVISTGLAEMIPTTPTVPIPGSVANAVSRSETKCDSFLDLLETAGLPTPIEADLDAVAALNYTGGTTGMPKGCIHSQREMIFTCAKACRTNSPLYEGEITLNIYPLFWIAGEDLGILFPIFTGATCVLLARWDTVSFMAAVQYYQVQRAVMLVDSAVDVMDHPLVDDFDLTSIETTGVSSLVKKLNPQYRDRWKRLTGSVMVELSFGMTETHTCDTFTRGMQRDDFDLSLPPITVGLPVPGTEFKICDFETHKLLDIGQEGEICVRSPSVLKAYWRQPKATADSIVNGWLRTGDIGTIDELGLIRFLGRQKEMLKVRGMSVSPVEIEAFLCMHPAVDACGVIGRPDEARGQVPVAFVCLAPEQVGAVTAGAIHEWCREVMASYKAPEIRIVDQLAMTATGKVKKFELEKLL